jgi:hypothetical protein
MFRRHFTPFDFACKEADFLGEETDWTHKRSWIMNAMLQVDSHHYRCRSCHKIHIGPTRTLDFLCVREQKNGRWAERFYEAEFTAHCLCHQTLKMKFRVREYPPGNFSHHSCQSVDIDLLDPPHVREHEDLLCG